MLKLADLYRMLEVYNVDVWMEGRYWVMRLRETNCDPRFYSKSDYDLEDLLLRAIQWRRDWTNDHKPF